MGERNKIAHHVGDQVIFCTTLETKRQEFQALFRHLERVSGQKPGHAFSRKLRRVLGLCGQRAKRQRENEIADRFGFRAQVFRAHSRRSPTRGSVSGDCPDLLAGRGQPTDVTTAALVNLTRRRSRSSDRLRR